MPRTSGIGDPLLRFFADAGREARELTAHNCPTFSVVAAPAWKHWALVVAGSVIAAGIVLAGSTWPDWGPSYGPGLARLLKSTSSPVITWLYSLALFTTAQIACLILWARSRNERDFQANYRIWGWAAATWLFFSFAIATRAHLAFSETVLYHIHWRTPGATLWCWLLPATAWGWGIALRLEPELRTDRAGHLLFLAAGGWYMAVAGILCQQECYPRACPASLSILLAAAFQLLGHASLLLSASLHARYVLLFSAEPPAMKRRTAAKATPAAETEEAQPPRRWLGLLSWARRTSAAEGAESEEDKPKRGKKRTTTTKKKAPARKTTRRSKAVEEEAESEDGWEEEPAAEEGWETAESTDGTESAPAADETSTDDKNYRFDSAEDGDNDDSDEMKGLSKKERRRLQAQMREEARRTR